MAVCILRQKDHRWQSAWHPATPKQCPNGASIANCRFHPNGKWQQHCLFRRAVIAAQHIQACSCRNDFAKSVVGGRAVVALKLPIKSRTPQKAEEYTAQSQKRKMFHGITSERKTNREADAPEVGHPLAIFPKLPFCNTCPHFF